MSKILLPTMDYPPQRGGVARYLYSFKQSLGDRLDVLYWKDETPRGLFLLKAIRLAYIKHDSEEILTSHIFPIGTALYLINKLFKTKYIVVLHGMDFDLARRNVLRRFIAFRILKNARIVIANSKALALEIEKFSNRKVETVYPILSEWTQNVQLQCNVVKNGINLLTVGRLVKRKGHYRVIRALVDLPDEVTYTIVGGGPEEDNLRDYIAELGLESRVTIKTEIEDDELAELYRVSDIFVMPTFSTARDREGFGIVYLEAQYMEKPVIASNLPGVDEAVIHGEGGILINTDEELFEAIKQLVENADLRHNLGVMGRMRVNKLFTQENQRKILEKIL